MSTTWPRFPILYEINTRVWLRELSRKAGKRITLDTVPAGEIERIAALGFHGIWLMGVWTTGPKAVEVARSRPEWLSEFRAALPDFKLEEDVIGSPYAVSAYECSPDLGGPKALKAMRARMAQAGLRLMLDFVPNHFSCDHPLMATQPDVFVQGTEEDLREEPQNYFKGPGDRIFAHGRDPFFAGWPDTVQVNYAQPAGRARMLQELQGVAAQCDAVRCDMAMLLLPDVHQRTWKARLGPNPVLESFWKGAVAEVVKRNPGFLFLAECYWDTEWRMQQEGFHFTYDKTLYDRLKHGDFSGAKAHLRAEPGFRDKACHFIENHDEPRAAGEFGPERSRAAAVASFFAPGLRLLHEGQLEGAKVKLPVHLGRRREEPRDAAMAAFYERTLSVLRDPVFQDGTFVLRDLRPADPGDRSFEAVTAYEWRPPQGRTGLGHLIVVNLAGTPSVARIPLDADRYEDGRTYGFEDLADGRRYEREGGELRSLGLCVVLEPYQAHLFRVSAL